MNKTKSATGATQKLKKPLTPAESGLSFTVATFSILIASLLFTVAIAIIAMASGKELTQFTQSISKNVLYQAFSFSISSLSLCMAVLIICKLKKRTPFVDIPLKKPKPKFWIIGILLVVGMMFGLSELNTYFISLLQKFGYTKPEMFLPKDNWYELALWIVFAAALPAVFEEFIFRGYLLEGAKQFGTVFAVIVCGLLFSIFHQNPQQTPYQFVCGMVFALLAIKSGSVLPCILVHFINNVTILIFHHFSIAFSPTAKIVISAIAFAFLLGGLVWLILSKTEKTEPAEIENPVNHTKTRFFLYAFPGFAACVIMWIADILSYFGG